MFSVVMAAYNAALFIREAIESVLAQTYTDFELIIVNDGSNDDTQKLAEAYAAGDAHVQVITHERNGGIAVARNTGLFAARRPWIVIHDSDDRMVPQRLQIYAEHISSQPDVIAWGGMARAMSVTGELLYSEALGPATRQAFAEMREKAIPVIFTDGAFAYRRDIGQSIGGYNPQLIACDLDLMDRLSEHGVMICIQQVLEHWRVHAGSTTQMKFEGNARSLRYVFFRRAQQGCGLPAPTYDQFLEWYHAQPPLTRLRWKCVDRSRMYRMRFPEKLGRKQYLSAALTIGLAAFYHPAWFVDKVRRSMVGSRHV